MKNKKKGFTLVELIVVLAILAILAAMLVPALTGYIDKANSQKVVAECRQVVMAAQSEASSVYGTSNGKLATGTTTIKADNVKDLSEVKGYFAVTINDDGTVASVSYTNNGWTVEYTGSTASYSTPTKASTNTANSCTVQTTPTGSGK